MASENHLDIVKAANFGSNILDAEARLEFRCKPYTRNSRGKDKGLAEYYKGTFCVALPMTAVDTKSSKKLCYRIWYIDDYENRRFKEICASVSEMIASQKLNYFVSYQYLPKAIQVNGIALPGVKMEWIDGLTLDQWLIKNRGNVKSIKKLAADFLQMCKDFSKAGIAHGDLSNSNILITDRNEIRLIDYDSVYVPSMRDAFYQTTAGQAAFQHPERVWGKRLKMTSKDDNFSQQVIYLSLLAIAHDVSLVDWISENELLFTSGDFQSESDFIKSRAYKRLQAVTDSEISARLAELKAAVKGPLSAVSSIVDLQVEPAKRYVEFCHICGHKYPNSTDAYCTRCGTQRLVYLTK
jgi:serine/threonine protein kinase